MTRDPIVRRAYRTCARMQLRHDPTYFWATRRLPSEVRPAVHALYGFVRGADELVDGHGPASDPEASRAALDAWQAELEDGLANGGSDHPIIAALVDAGPRHALPLGELRVYMDSMRIDCGPVRIASRDELDRYMRGSAGAVGTIMATLMDARADELARMGTAFQLTNFIRDVAEDYALDRIYLPGLDEDALRAGHATAETRALVAAETSRARELFASTSAVAGTLAPALRPGVRLARSVYAAVLDRVERVDFDVLGRRAALNPFEVGRAVVAA